MSAVRAAVQKACRKSCSGGPEERLPSWLRSHTATVVVSPGELCRCNSGFLSGKARSVERCGIACSGWPVERRVASAGQPGLPVTAGKRRQRRMALARQLLSCMLIRTTGAAVDLSGPAGSLARLSRCVAGGFGSAKPCGTAQVLQLDKTSRRLLFSRGREVITNQVRTNG